MEPDRHEIVELAAMSVLGIGGIVSCGDDVGPLWEPGFVQRMKEIQALAVIPNRYYGVSFDEGGHLYVAGMVVAPPERVPEGLVLREIPAGTYVRFEGSFEDWWCQAGPSWVYDTWLPESGYEHHQATTFRDFVIHGVAGRVTFCVPVRRVSP